MSVRIPEAMFAVVLTGHGGPGMLELRDDVPVPIPGAGEVLIRVAAAGINNTDINTRLGWYSKSVTTATGTTGATEAGADGGWTGAPIDFPRIQGADVCGRIVAVGAGVTPERISERVIVEAMQPGPSGDPFDTVTLGSELDGGFAEYVAARADVTHRIDSDWSDVELASIPCAYSTAENMLERVGVADGDRVLVTGASGGVGSAVIQLARRRGAEVFAVASPHKADALRDIGATDVIDRGADLTMTPGSESMDVVVDLVAGPQWGQLLEVLRRGGRYVAAGAIAGPIVDLDVRTLYLKDLTLAGATAQTPGVFARLIGHVERGDIQPLVHATFPLAEIGRAQEAFLRKDFVGKLVVVPPADVDSH